MASLHGSLLWSVKHQESEQESYLFGTMHVKDYRAFGWMDQIREIIRGCSIYAAESEIDKQAEQTSHLYLDSGASLQSLLGERNFHKIRKIVLKSFGVDIQVYSRFLPIIICQIIAERVLANSYSISLDANLWTYATEMGIPCIGVESAEKQIEILQSIPLSYQVRAMKRIGKNISSFRKNIEKMITAYEDQNTDYLFKNSKQSLGEMRKVMLYDRNLSMSITIENLIKEKKAFIGIGAGHLFGKKGVLSELKAKNVKIRSVLLN